MSLNTATSPAKTLTAAKNDMSVHKMNFFMLPPGTGALLKYRYIEKSLY